MTRDEYLQHKESCYQRKMDSRCSHGENNIGRCTYGVCPYIIDGCLIPGSGEALMDVDEVETEELSIKNIRQYW